MVVVAAAGGEEDGARRCNERPYTPLQVKFNGTARAINLSRPGDLRLEIKSVPLEQIRPGG